MKYIERQNLPQFKYYHFCEGQDYGWDFGNDQDSSAYFRPPVKPGDISPVDIFMSVEEGKLNFELAAEDFEKLLNDNDRDTVKEMYEKWCQKFAKTSESWQLMEFVMVLVDAVMKDELLAKKWKERIYHQSNAIREDRLSLLLFLSMIDEFLMLANILRTAQGFPLKYKDGEISYPKMLLIEDTLYKDAMSKKDKVIEYMTIKRAVRDACWVLTINGESGEKKMVFLIYDAGECISVAMLDARNGMSRFFLRHGNAESRGGAYLNADAWHCHPRGDYWCHGKDDICTYCNGEHNCKHKTLDIISSVLYCFQEYYKKIQTEEKTVPEHKKTQSREGIAEPFVPTGMMRLYDVRLSESEFRRKDKFELYSRGHHERMAYNATKKSPHIRRGTMRYNPKTRQRDITVRGSIIHRERYTGFASAERIKS